MGSVFHCRRARPASPCPYREGRVCHHPAGAAASAPGIAQHFVTFGPFYVIATVRVTFGLVLISVASVSRAPKTLRVVGYLILIAGIMTALTGLVAIERARASIEWWLQQGTGVVRLTGVLVLAFGGFVAYACAPRSTRCLTSA